MTTLYATCDWAERLSANATFDRSEAEEWLRVDQWYGVQSRLVQRVGGGLWAEVPPTNDENPAQPEG